MSVFPCILNFQVTILIKRLNIASYKRFCWAKFAIPVQPILGEVWAGMSATLMLSWGLAFTNSDRRLCIIEKVCALKVVHLNETKFIHKFVKVSGTCHWTLPLHAASRVFMCSSVDAMSMISRKAERTLITFQMSLHVGHFNVLLSKWISNVRLV